MILKKIKMPSCMQGCHILKTRFNKIAKESTIYPTQIRMSECYIYCNEKDREAVKMIIEEFKERYHGA